MNTEMRANSVRVSVSVNVNKFVGGAGNFYNKAPPQIQLLPLGQCLSKVIPSPNS